MSVDFRRRFTMEAKWGTTLATGFMGTTKYVLANLLEEHYSPARHDVTGVFEAYRVDTNTNERAHCVVMICEQLNPGLLDPNQISGDQSLPTSSATSSCSTRYWENRLIFDACFNPYDNGSFIENIDQVQSQDGSFPGGYLHLFAAAVPSKFEPMQGLPVTLTEDDLLAIKLGLCRLPASKRNVVLSCSYSFFSSSNASSTDNIRYDMAAIWYNRDTKRIWVAGNTVSNWYARESETAQRTQQQRTDPVKNFEEFWMGFVKRWECRRRKLGYAVDIQKVSSFHLSFRDRDNNNSNDLQNRGLPAFSDSTTSSPSSEKGWTMIEDDGASS